MNDWRNLVTQLRGKVEFDSGLRGAEAARVEQQFDFRFPPDLLEFLQTALPRGAQFPDWRSGEPATGSMCPGGVLFDVEYNDYWHPDLNARPLYD